VQDTAVGQGGERSVDGGQPWDTVFAARARQGWQFRV
jgi:hypothetical protein